MEFHWPQLTDVLQPISSLLNVMVLLLMCKWEENHSSNLQWWEWDHSQNLPLNFSWILHINCVSQVSCLPFAMQLFRISGIIWICYTLPWIILIEIFCFERIFSWLVLMCGLTRSNIAIGFSESNILKQEIIHLRLEQNIKPKLNSASYRITHLLKLISSTM